MRLYNALPTSDYTVADREWTATPTETIFVDNAVCLVRVQRDAEENIVPAAGHVFFVHLMHTNSLT